MFFVAWSSGGNSSPYLSLLFLLPLLLQSGAGIYSFLPHAFTRPGLVRPVQAPVLVGGARQALADDLDAWLWVPAFCVGVFICLFTRQARQQGWWAALRSLFPWNLDTARRQARSAGTGRRSQRQLPVRTHSQRFSEVVAVLQKLPVEHYVSAEKMRKLPAHQLKEEMRRCGLPARKGEGIDREDAISRILELRDSSRCACSVCCEEYEADDVLHDGSASVYPCTASTRQNDHIYIDKQSQRP
ncbi:hypothetical protein WJX73_007123 [Symbiochloris irregularis]|uniref:Uncharacterized protein n=1 Tax=Symbiochloris irregularis TaxID=706552 RepID=A0AAW1NQL2_9CHLO